MGASSFTNRAQPGMYSSCPIRNCASTNWRTCRTKLLSCFAWRQNPIRPTRKLPMTTETPTINYKIGNERLISVTEKAAQKLASVLEEKGKSDGALRLKVVGGGCSGLQYVMDLVDGPKERDILVPKQSMRLVIDPK